MKTDYLLLRTIYLARTPGKTAVSGLFAGKKSEKTGKLGVENVKKSVFPWILSFSWVAKFR
jgi:hypothetical protein